MYDFYFSTLYCEEREGVTRNEETEGLKCAARRWEQSLKATASHIIHTRGGEKRLQSGLWAIPDQMQWGAGNWTRGWK